VRSYRAVARNLVEIAGWFSGSRQIGDLVQRVATGELFHIDNPPVVGLLIYGFDDDQKRGQSWAKHIAKLENEIGMPLRYAGDPKNIHLCAGEMRKGISAAATA
jgi:hypothetical protein